MVDKTAALAHHSLDLLNTSSSFFANLSAVPLGAQVQFVAKQQNRHLPLLVNHYVEGCILSISSRAQLKVAKEVKSYITTTASTF